MNIAVTCPRCGQVRTSDAEFCVRCGESMLVTLPTPEPRSVWDEVEDILRSATRGEYDVAGKLGHGGMAAVYLAHDISLDKKIAIKVMAPALMADSSMVSRFQDEARTVARLEHPNIVTVHAAKQAGGLYFFVMRYVPGRDLESLLAQGPLSLAVTQAIVFQVASALQYAHGRNVIHRDVKPSNIMVDYEGDAVVMDFGIAKLRGAQGHTVLGAAIGTPPYMSPEQCESRDVGPESDQYSLGMVAYQLLTGRPPFTGAPLAVMRQQVEVDPPPVEQLPEGRCPGPVRDALRRMLSKAPGQRWPSVVDAARAFGGRPLEPDDPLRSVIVQRLHEGEAIQPTKIYETPLSPTPFVGRGAPSIPPTAVAPPPPTAVANASASAVRLPPTTWQTPPPRPLPKWWLRPAVWMSGAGTIALVATAVWSLTRPPAPPPALLQVMPAEVSLSPGSEAQLNSTGTAPVAWRSTDTTIVTVDAAGRLQGVREGQALVIAESGSGADSSVVTVVGSPEPVARLSIQPGDVAVRIGRTSQLQMDAFDNAGRRISAPAVRWLSSAPSVADVSPSGLVTGRTEGVATIFVISGTTEARATIRVQGETVSQTRQPTAAPAVAPVAALSVNPFALDLRVGESQSIVVELRDGRGQPLSRSVAFRSEDERIAVLEGAGTVRGIAPGTTHVIASSESIEGRVTVVVREAAPPLDSGLRPKSVELPTADQTSGPIAQMLRARDAAGIRRTHSEDDDAAKTTKAALLRLVERSPVQMGPARIVNSSPNGDGATSEFSTILNWRAFSGASRRAEVRIAVSFARDADQWRITQWRILGVPDLR